MIRATTNNLGGMIGKLVKQIEDEDVNDKSGLVNSIAKKLEDKNLKRLKVTSIDDDILSDSDKVTVRKIESVLEQSKIDERSRREVEEESETIEQIGLLSNNSTNLQIIHKLNELINAFNKTLSDYRI